MHSLLATVTRHKDKKVKLPWFDVALPLIPVAAIVIALIVSFFFINPAPPHHIRISVARENADYQEYASQYRDILGRDKVTLEILPSEGALDSLQHLKDEDSGINVAFTQDGLHNGEDADAYSLGAISYDPIWLFYRGKKVYKRLGDFQHKKLAVGKPNSGTLVLSQRLLAANGITEQNTSLISTGRDEAVLQLKQGKLDAIFLIGQPDSPLIKELLLNPAIHPLDFDQADGYVRRFPFLHSLMLPHGTVDLRRNIPSQDLHLLATTTTIVVNDGLDSAIVYLLLQAMKEVHDRPTLLNREHTFPEDKDTDFDLSPDAQHFYRSGPPFLQRYLPFWLATSVDRWGIVLVPMFAILFPILRLLPQVYRWLIKRRINQWYGELIALEAELLTGTDKQEHLRRLDWIEEQVARLPVPLAFSDLSYVLKEHIDLVRRKIRRLRP